MTGRMRVLRGRLSALVPPASRCVATYVVVAEPFLSPTPRNAVFAGGAEQLPDISCGSCGRGLHFVGQCGSWLRGAHHAFAPSTLEERTLCPDCALLWIRELAAAPSSAHGGFRDHDVGTHMAAVTAAGEPGAGSQSVVRRTCTRVRVRTAVRWIRRFLRRRTWVAESRLIRLCAAQLHGGDVGLANSLQASREALGSLRGAGELFVGARGRQSAVRLRRGEGATPARHSRRGCRRRGQEDDAEARPTRARRSR